MHSWIEPIHPKLPFFEDPLLVALIDLKEGPRLLSNLCDVKPEDVITGMEVEVFFVPSEPGGERRSTRPPVSPAEDIPMTAAKRAAIAGIGQTEFSKNSGRSELTLASECIRAALDDAGLSPANVDGMTTFTLDNNEDVDSFVLSESATYASPLASLTEAVARRGPWLMRWPR